MANKHCLAIFLSSTFSVLILFLLCIYALLFVGLYWICRCTFTLSLHVWLLTWFFSFWWCNSAVYSLLEVFDCIYLSCNQKTSIRWLWMAYRFLGFIIKLQHTVLWRWLMLVLFFLAYLDHLFYSELIHWRSSMSRSKLNFLLDFIIR